MSFHCFAGPKITLQFQQYVYSSDCVTVFDIFVIDNALLKQRFKRAVDNRVGVMGAAKAPLHKS